jgi:hypothetical protein
MIRNKILNKSEQFQQEKQEGKVESAGVKEIIRAQASGSRSTSKQDGVIGNFSLESNSDLN